MEDATFRNANEVSCLRFARFLTHKVRHGKGCLTDQAMSSNVKRWCETDQGIRSWKIRKARGEISYVNFCCRFSFFPSSPPWAKGCGYPSGYACQKFWDSLNSLNAWLLPYSVWGHQLALLPAPDQFSSPLLSAALGLHNLGGSMEELDKIQLPMDG